MLRAVFLLLLLIPGFRSAGQCLSLADMRSLLGRQPGSFDGFMTSRGLTPAHLTTSFKVDWSDANGRWPNVQTRSADTGLPTYQVALVRPRPACWRDLLREIQGTAGLSADGETTLHQRHRFRFYQAEAYGVVVFRGSGESQQVTVYTPERYQLVKEQIEQESQRRP
jgi:hypothetical protein